MIKIVALAAAFQVPSAPTAPAREDRTAFCWAAITNATVRAVAVERDMPRGELPEALNYLNGRIRALYPDDEQLVQAMRAGAEAFGRADMKETAVDCLREYREEMSRFIRLTERSLDR